MQKPFKKIICLLMCALVIASCACLSSIAAGTASSNITAGDINADGEVNNKDLTRLMKYLSGEEISVVEILLDTNGDSYVNNKDLTRLMKHISGDDSSTIYPITHTVIFKDYDGTVLSTQKVLSGQGAVAPSSPVRDGYVFAGWDKSFANITSDLVITAQYTKESAEKHTVTFTDYDGKVLSVQEVSEGSSAILPQTPVKSGTSFLGWSGNYSNVMKDETLKAVYSDERNVFIVESASGSVGETVTVLVAIDGSVKTCGFDLDLFYDPALELVSYDNDLDLDIIINDAIHTNGIKLNFSSASDKTKQRDIIELTFKIKDTTKMNLPIWFEISDVYEVTDSGTIKKVSYAVVDGVITVK